MVSRSSGSLYEALERLGEYQPKAYTFCKKGVDYSMVDLRDTIDLSRDSLIIERDYRKVSKVTFERPIVKVKIRQ